MQHNHPNHPNNHRPQVMSGELDTVFRSMAVGAVPGLWKGKSFPSLKPLAGYVADLIARCTMLNVSQCVCLLQPELQR